jgi:hypothetical protein
MTKITLGSKVRDTITGFEGIATARAEYLSGCVRILVQPYGLTKDGKMFEGEWIDQGLLEAVKAEKENATDVTGGPVSNEAPGW